MARDMDAYRASLDSPSNEPLPSRRRRRRWSKRLLSVFSLLFLIGVVIAVVLVLHKSGEKGNETATNVGGNTNNSSSTPADSNGSSNSSNSSKNGATNSSTSISTPGSGSNACTVLRRPPAHKRTVVFWQSEVAGCETVPLGVTHVVFGFALVDGPSGIVNATFQNTDAEIKRCVKALRANCIASMGSIGGSTNNDAIANLTNAEAFAASAVALVEKFGFDGVDIDDETVGPMFNASRAVTFVEATRKALDAKDATLLLTYDGYFNEGQPSFCTSPAYASYTRCFPTELLASLDWVNIMAYNVAQDEVVAAGIYANATNTTFAEWKTQLNGDFTKATIGVCVKSSCAYGPGPSADVIASWNTNARLAGTGGGMMVYAASGEVADNFAVTRSLLA